MLCELSYTTKLVNLITIVDIFGNVKDRVSELVQFEERAKGLGNWDAIDYNADFYPLREPATDIPSFKFTSY